MYYMNRRHLIIWIIDCMHWLYIEVNKLSACLSVCHIHSHIHTHISWFSLDWPVADLGGGGRSAWQLHFIISHTHTTCLTTCLTWMQCRINLVAKVRFLFFLLVDFFPRTSLIRHCLDGWAPPPPVPHILDPPLLTYLEVVMFLDLWATVGLGCSNARQGLACSEQAVQRSIHPISWHVTISKS